MGPTLELRWEGVGEVNCPFLLPESQRPVGGEGWIPKGKLGPREPKRREVNAGQAKAIDQQAVSSSPQRVVMGMK